MTSWQHSLFSWRSSINTVSGNPILSLIDLWLILHSPFFVNTPLSFFQIVIWGEVKVLDFRLSFDLYLHPFLVKSSLVWFLILFSFRSVTESFVELTNSFVAFIIIDGILSFFTLMVMLTHHLPYLWIVKKLLLGFCFLLHSIS